MSRTSELQREIARLGPWFHNLHLPDGTQTCPEHVLGDFPLLNWQRIHHVLPADLSGWRALDIGCNAGFYTFELARRGADVTGLDVSDHYLRQARWAARLYGLEDRVAFRRGAIYDLARGDETWDLVLFMGVIYHLRYPLLGLDIVSRRVGRLLLFQGMTMPGEEVARTPPDMPLDDRDPFLDPGWPKMAFIEHATAGDRTNWWAPNHACMEAMVRSAGLQVLDRPAREFYLCAPDPDGPSSHWRWNAEEYAKAVGGPVPQD